MTSNEIRTRFIDFFKERGHAFAPSAPVVPYDDPTLLFINAGMNQFKDVFLGKGSRDYARAVNSQKCIRVSGKHNDLEEVGRDTYHHTFFEMLGNWSFGDYYKAEAIEWAWALLTDVWKLDKKRLWATVYQDDDEAFELWKEKTDIDPKRILRFGEKDNFWEMGDTGPCGPCSEIHISLGDDYDDPKQVNAGLDSCIEIWNLVFIQYNRDEKGELRELPKKHVDTGMGFERVCAVLQNKPSNYETDVFMPLIEEMKRLSGAPYKGKENQTSMRVAADHARALTFAIADGAAPGNEGRGYVLRRILRRAARYGRKLGLKEPYLHKLVGVVVETMGGAYPEIVEKREMIEKIVKGEEESFNDTLDRGIELFNRLVADLKKRKKKTISGDDAFKLYDTFGFPIDLTRVMAEEEGLAADEKRFEELMTEQRRRARADAKSKTAGASDVAEGLGDMELTDKSPTVFTGYDELVTKARVVGVKRKNGETLVALDKSPFYVEAGGQVDDHGVLEIGKERHTVTALAKFEGIVLHAVEEKDAKIKPGASAIAKVDETRRRRIMRNHSATHLLHAALRETLGDHVRQSGSFVGPDYFRFDFTHFEKTSDDDLRKIEKRVNEKILANLPASHMRDVPLEEAKDSGALMFFGDKYGERVNVMKFGDYSAEFCGGTHVGSTAEIGLMKIVGEASVAGGVRRIEAVTGDGVLRYLEEREREIAERDARIEELQKERRKFDKKLAEAKAAKTADALPEIMSGAIEIDGVALYRGRVEVDSMDALKALGDRLREKITRGVGLTAAEIEGKVMMACVVSDDLVKEKLSAGKIVGEAAKIVGGGGGGRPHLATAGGKDVSKIDEALAALDEIVKKMRG
jgi:alanyl-tRNA synthetase